MRNKYTTQKKLNGILGISGIEQSLTNDYLNEAHEQPVGWGHFDRTGIKHTEDTKQLMSENRNEGAKRFQGVPCKKAGHTERYVSSRHCVTCLKERDRSMELQRKREKNA